MRLLQVGCSHPTRKGSCRSALRAQASRLLQAFYKGFKSHALAQKARLFVDGCNQTILSLRKHDRLLSREHRTKIT